MNKFRILLGVIFLLLFTISAFYLGQQFSKKSNKQTCTQEAKICPDGSTVSRTGPKCEFAACSATIDNLVLDKITPGLANWLKTAKDSEVIKITIWIKDENPPPQTTRPPANQNIDRKQIDDFQKKVDQENSERVRRIVSPIVERLTGLGYEVETDSSAPVIYLTADKKFILDLATWEEILNIDRGDYIASPLSNDIENWQTYKDPKFKFQIQYPSSMDYYKNDKRDDLNLGGVSFMLNYNDDEFRPQASEIHISVFDSFGMTLEEWLANNSTEKAFGTPPDKEFYGFKNMGNTKIAGVDGI